MSDETELRVVREERLKSEYAAYLEECSQNNSAPLNYMNWHANKKREEQWE